MMYKYVLSILLFFTVGCGFTPLYMTHNDEKTTDLTAQVNIVPIANFEGFQLQTLLADQLNPDKKKVPKTYDLIVSLDKPQLSEQNIQEDNFSSRERMILTARYKLIDKSTKKVLVDTQTHATGAYNIAIEPYATYMAKKKVLQDLTKMLSQTISLHIISYFKKHEGASEG